MMILATDALIKQIAERLQGIPVFGTVPGTPAEKSGLRRGDIILYVNGHRAGIGNPDEIFKEHGNVYTIWRDGEELIKKDEP